MLRNKFRMVLPVALAAATAALTMASPAQAAGDNPGDMQLITSDGVDLSHTIRDFWGNWQQFGHLGGYTAVHELTSTYHFGEENAFFLHDNNQLAHLIRHNNGQWNTLASAPDGAGVIQLTSTDVDGHLTLVAVRNGTVQTTRENTDGTWAAWTDVPTDGHGVVDVAAVAEGGTLKVVELDQDFRHIGEFERSPNGTWTSDGWTWIAPDSGMSALSIAAAQVDNTLHVAAVETDGFTNAVYHTVRPDNGQWQTLPGNLTGPISDHTAGAPWYVAVAPWEGALQLVYSANNGDLKHTIRHTDGTWQSWGLVQAAAGNVTAGPVTMATNPLG